jgi:hypothetical protein
MRLFGRCDGQPEKSAYKKQACSPVDRRTLSNFLSAFRPESTPVYAVSGQVFWLVRF